MPKTNLTNNKNHCVTKTTSTKTQSFNFCSKDTFIFINGNDIEKRILERIDTNVTIPPFVIAEPDFANGFNFILTLQLYQKLLSDLEQRKTNKIKKKSNIIGNIDSIKISKNLNLPPLHFISVAQFPLTKAQLKESLSNFPLLAHLTDQLLNYYPDIKTNVNASCSPFEVSFLEEKVKLTILFQDAVKGLSTITTPKLGVGIVDAWYLKSSTAENNTEMHFDELFNQIARLSKPQASITTDMIEDIIRDKLRHIGYRLEKRTSSDNQTEMYYGLFQNSPLTRKGYQLRPQRLKPRHVSIIGGGIASACLAYELTKQGVEITIYCKDNELSQGASSNAIGALYPLIHQKRDDISLFYQKALHQAKSLYNEIDKNGFQFEHDWCGLLELSYKHSLEMRQLAIEEKGLWPKSLIHGVTPEEATDISGVKQCYGGLFIPKAGWVSPQSLVKALFKASTATGLLNLKMNTEIKHLKQLSTEKHKKEKIEESQDSRPHEWEMHTRNEVFKASVLVVCAGAESIALDVVSALPLNATRGQISSMQSNERIGNLSTVICHKGYLTPKNNGIHCIGATFQKNDFSLQTRNEDDLYNLNMLQKCLPSLTELINWQETDITSSKARLRCMTPDHLPMVGVMPNITAHMQTYPHLAKDKNWKYNQAPPALDNLYVMTGFGARGLCTAPLCAQILSAELCAMPYPVDTEMLFNISPNRFIIRDIIKRKVIV